MTPNPKTRPERIDAHHHVWKLARGDYAWLRPDHGALHRDHAYEELVPALDRAGIERTVLVQAAPTVSETHFLLGVARANPRVAGVVGWVDFESRTVAAEIEALSHEPALVGLRPMIHDLPSDTWMLRRELTDAFRAVSARQLTFDALVRPQHLLHLRKLVARHPELDVVIDHLAKPRIVAGGAKWDGFTTWAKHMKALAAESRACVKLSGLVTEAEPGWTVADLRPCVELVLEAFGPERVLWGSDWPVLTLACDYARWVAATDELLVPLSADARAAVLGGNAARFYRLGAKGRVTA